MPNLYQPVEATEQERSMSSRREFAISLGLAIPGRGRLSREANAACDEAASKGRVFEGPTTSVAAPRVKKAKGGVFAKTVRQPTQVEDDEQFNVQDALYPNEQTWRSEDGQILNGRAVCSPCGYSLQYHRCSNPSAVVSPGVLSRVTLVV
jgi:hypothetical protein